MYRGRELNSHGIKFRGILSPLFQLINYCIFIYLKNAFSKTCSLLIQKYNQLTSIKLYLYKDLLGNWIYLTLG